jgi:hypothetical protein
MYRPPFSWPQIHVPAALGRVLRGSSTLPRRTVPCSRGKSPQYPLDKRLGELQSRSGGRIEEEDLDLPGLKLRPFGRPARSQALHRLRCPGSQQCESQILYAVKIFKLKNMLAQVVMR